MQPYVAGCFHLDNACEIRRIADSVHSFFLFIIAQCLIVWVYHSLFIQSPADGHLGGFQFGAIGSKAAMNILEHVFWWPYVELS